VQFAHAIEEMACSHCEGSGSVPSRCPTCRGQMDWANQGRQCIVKHTPDDPATGDNCVLCSDPWHGGGSDTRKDAPI
jgi:DnaJ-class molecular chaperone